MILMFVTADQIILYNPQWKEKLESVVDNLDPTEDGESSEEAHGSADQPKRWLHCHLVKI